LRHGIHPMPVHSVPLATTPKRVKPVADDLGSEAPECVDVGRHGVVGEVASRDLAEPATLFGQGLVPAPLQGSFERLQRYFSPYPVLTLTGARRAGAAQWARVPGRSISPRPSASAASRRYVTASMLWSFAVSSRE
jgi:hypothetical protein